MFREYFLPPMTREDCTRMIVDIGYQMGLEYAPDALDCIYQYSGGNPFLARQLGSLIWKELRNSKTIVQASIQEKDVKGAVDTFMTDGRRVSYLEQIWEMRLTAQEQSLLKQLVHAQTPVLLTPSEEIVANNLAERYIIKKEGKSCKLGFELLRLWIAIFILGVS
jgi:hypothetical protein